MEQFSDIGIVLSVRPHGESGAVATLLTENAGLYSGYVYGAQAASKNALLEPGTEVSADWTARTSDQLGRFKLEKIKNWSGAF